MLDFGFMKRRSSVTFVIPVYNEQIDLPICISKLLAFLTKNLSKYDWNILIADNASTDRTASIGKELSKKAKVNYLKLEEKGRGRALKKSWTTANSDVLFYMDVDLSSELKFIKILLKEIENGADIAIGSRLIKGAKVHGRTCTRELISKSYSFMFRILFQTKFKDAQCGFKAITKKASKDILPIVEDTEWFFDSELLIIAEKAGYKIAEVPIVWRDDPDSTVKVVKTARGDIEGLIRLFIKRPWRSLKK